MKLLAYYTSELYLREDNYAFLGEHNGAKWYWLTQDGFDLKQANVQNLTTVVYSKLNYVTALIITGAGEGGHAEVEMPLHIWANFCAEKLSA